jgi:hypothetical protein
VINWRLVVNLVGALLLLIEARRRWFARASDEDIRRREARKNILLAVGSLAWFYAGVPLLSVRIHVHPVLVFWGPIVILWAGAELHRRFTPRLRREWYRADYLRYHGGPLDGRALMWPGKDEPMWSTVVDSAYCLVPRIPAPGGHYDLNREKARYEWQADAPVLTNSIKEASE